MKLTIFFDELIGMTHIAKHDVAEAEIVDFFVSKRYIVHKRLDGSRSALGETSSGRRLEVVYRVIEKGWAYVITGYDIENATDMQRLEDFLETL